MLHYWPIRRKSKCRDLKFEVELGNKPITTLTRYLCSANETWIGMDFYCKILVEIKFSATSLISHKKILHSINLQAQAIGKVGSKLIEEFLTMRNVYDYMFHLLNEYSKLLKFKPTIPSKAKRVCAETTACSEKGLWKEFMVQSMVKSPSDKLPCALPPPISTSSYSSFFLNKNEKITRQVETEYWSYGKFVQITSITRQIRSSIEPFHKSNSKTSHILYENHFFFSHFEKKLHLVLTKLNIKVIK